MQSFLAFIITIVKIYPIINAYIREKLTLSGRGTGSFENDLKSRGRWKHKRKILPQPQQTESLA